METGRYFNMICIKRELTVTRRNMIPKVGNFRNPNRKDPDSKHYRITVFHQRIPSDAKQKIKQSSMNRHPTDSEIHCYQLFAARSEAPPRDLQPSKLLQRMQLSRIIQTIPNHRFLPTWCSINLLYGRLHHALQVSISKLSTK